MYGRQVLHTQGTRCMRESVVNVAMAMWLSLKKKKIILWNHQFHPIKMVTLREALLAAADNEPTRQHGRIP